ncbi:MAG TPA: hypothetical protein VLZ75_14035 [Chitinophagales bacterium]|nr:hypothetical protein [Chitinophagales bacterium]
MKKTLSIITALIVVISIAIFSFYYFGYYEEGDMSGKVMRISQKGFVFKTYEGKINLESFGALRGASPIQEVFDFSVEKSNQEVINTLQEVSLTGERVNLHYVKRYAKFFWRGDTQYFVDSVTRSANKSEETQE